MKALSIRAPWSYLILKGLKTVENRTYRTNYRGDFLIHTGVIFEGSQDVFGYIQTQLWDLGTNLDKSGIPHKREQYKLGGFIGIATLTDCVQVSGRPFFVGPYGWLLKDIKPIEFIPYKGALGFFNVDDSLITIKEV